MTIMLNFPMKESLQRYKFMTFLQRLKTIKLVQLIIRSTDLFT